MRNVFFLDVVRPETDEFNDFKKAYVEERCMEPDNFALMAHATSDYILDIVNKYHTEDGKEIMRIANDGHQFNSIIGAVSVTNNEFNFQTTISSVL